jgi:hypothetical protein
VSDTPNIDRSIQTETLSKLVHEREIRRDMEYEQLLADIRLKNRQTTTEFWKVGIALIVAGAVSGGLIVQVLNMIGG